MEVFNWKPAPGASAKVKPAVLAAKFGDGYEQRIVDGLNSQPRKWSLRFTMNVPAVLAFLEARGGADSFQWTDPLGRTALWVCREWDPAHVGGDVFDLACTFEQVPA